MSYIYGLLQKKIVIFQDWARCDFSWASKIYHTSLQHNKILTIPIWSTSQSILFMIFLFEKKNMLKFDIIVLFFRFWTKQLTAHRYKAIFNKTCYVLRPPIIMLHQTSTKLEFFFCIWKYISFFGKNIREEMFLFHAGIV